MRLSTVKGDGVCDRWKGAGAREGSQDVKITLASRRKQTGCESINKELGLGACSPPGA